MSDPKRPTSKTRAGAFHRLRASFEMDDSLLVSSGFVFCFWKHVYRPRNILFT